MTRPDGRSSVRSTAPPGATSSARVKAVVESPARVVTPPRVWYSSATRSPGRAFYKEQPGFDETYVDWDDKWSSGERRVRMRWPG